MNKTMNNNNNILKPCPFCGGSAKESDFLNRKADGSLYSVGCSNEGCEVMPETSFHRTSKEAREAWNQRA